jgi:hypothetical protein
MDQPTTFSLATPKEEPKVFDIGVDTDPPLSGNALDGRTFKYHIALGENSPGFDEIKRNLSSGQEDQYKTMLQDQEMSSRAAVGKDLINSSIQMGVTEDPLLIASLTDVGQPPDKGVVLEEQYVKKALDYIGSQETTEAMMKAIEDDPMGLGEKYRGYEEVVVKNHITQKWVEKVNETVKNTGWAPYVGYWGMQAVQFPTWANIVGNWKDGPDSTAWTTGGALAEKVANIRAMDPVAMDKAIEAEVAALSALNPLDAQKFVEALKSYGSNDLAMNYVDDISMLPFGTAAKIGKKGVNAAVGAAKEAQDIQKATEAGKKLKEAQEAGQATGVAEGAGKAATDVPKADKPPSWEGEGYDAWTGWLRKPATKVYGKEAEDLLKGAEPSIQIDGKVFTSSRSTDPKNPKSHTDAVEEAKAAGYTDEQINAALERGGHGWSVDVGGDKVFLRDDQLLPKQEGRSIFPDKPNLKDPVDKEIEDTARAASAEGTDIPTALAGSGKPKAASTWEVRKNIAEAQLPDAPGALQRNWATALKKLSSWTNTKLKLNAGDNFHTGTVVDMEPLVKRFLDIVQQTTDVARVSRIPEEALNKAFDLAEKTYRDYYNRIQDRLLDIEGIEPIERILPGKSGLNVPMIKMNFGKGSGELFDSIEGAQQALRVYGLPVQDTIIKQSGGKYYLESYATVGEDKAIDFILTPENLPKKNTWSMLRNYIGGSKTQTSDFQSAQRAAVAHTESQLGVLIREVYAPYEKLGKRSRKALDDIMRVNQLEERIPGDPSSRGMYYKNGPELEKAFMDHKGRLPTEDEANAYFAVVRAADLDWMYRSWSQYRLKASQGFQNVTISRLVKEGKFADNTFEGRIVDRGEFPIDSGHNIDVLYIDEGGVVAKINLARATDAEKAALRRAQADNWTFTQPYQVRDPKVFKVSGDTDPIAFIVSPSAKRSGLRLDGQVNYRPGFHNEYQSEWFVKQAKVKNGRHEGDIAAMGFRTEAEAVKYGQRMDAARILLKDGKLDELKTYLQKNLPMDLPQFQRMFDEHLDIYQPIAVTKNGKRTTEKGFLNGNSFANQYGNIDTTLDELYNPSNRGLSDPFVAERDPVLWSVSDIGTENRPVYELKQAELLSPMLTQTKAMGKLIKNELYNDYQMTSAQHWIETFGDSLSVGGKPITKDQLRRNPLYYLSNAEVMGDPTHVRQANQLRRAIQNLVGSPSAIAESVDMFKHKMLSSIYNRFGEKYLSTAQIVADKVIPSVTDPVSHLRSLAFHTKLGLYNPVQFAVQSAALTNVIAISPVAGLQSIPAMLGARMLRLTENEGIIAKVGEHVAKLGGWSKDEFIDSYNLMRKTGFDTIGSESAWRNDVGDPTLYRSKMGRAFLDKGAFFFNEGERAVRVTAWNTAYKEFVGQNPKKIGKMTEFDIAAIRSRAQKLSGNMSRDANSWWQNNPATSVTTQFWSYNVRMAELMIGNQLTEAERYRLMFSQGMLWGFTPAALVAYGVEQGDWTPMIDSAGGLNPFAEDLQAYATKAGVQMDGTMADTLYYGMVSKWFETMTGTKFDFGSRYGMSAPQVLETFERTAKADGTLTAILVAAMGPSGSVVNEIFKESSNVFESMHDLYTGEETEGALLATDIGNAMREISSVNSWQRIGAAAFGASYRSQNGAMVTTGEDTLKDSISAIFGVEEAALGETFNLATAFSKDRKENEQDQKKAMRYSTMIWDAWQRGDKEEADRLRKVLRGYLAGTKLSPSVRLKLLFPDSSTSGEIDKIIMKSLIEQAKGSEKLNLQKEFQERYGN